MSSTAISRVDFLRGNFTGRTSVIRPPWSIAEALFTSVCDGCGDCIERCPTHIIKSSRGNYPSIDFEAGECLFCGDCVDACKPQALLRTDKKQAWNIAASIDTASCLAYQGVECRSCNDPCEIRAISFVPRVGGVSIPILNSTQCTGCGACYSVCPSRAISMNRRSMNEPIQESS